MGKKSWKTREIAKAIHVNPSTVQRWIKYFNLAHNVNSNGHFEIPNETYDQLKVINAQMKQGKKLSEVCLVEEDKVGKVSMIPAIQVEKKMEELLNQLDQLERKVRNKADDVVEYQILHQRKEINELNQIITQLSTRINILEDELVNKSTSSAPLNESSGKKRRLAGIFSF
ncbi:MerR family transcriptional regulator [Salipaludibacillus agaradhaerens]|uniref:helix-turn-helix domain-containing protein n=1 Tax=Salipaludibacillus agaradhaerens TaxID=76935 RepID=UPI002150D50A|nr:MerR family transcriptional regulator [Salipaludibacillus agaradhaerens]MCR6106624.1 MerR family transcriptional regulator [Salipaludibacillus agaradhaerens]MCR6118657.1 MerR family transcriptional regulator [Salipaludibacillus agaradhaerens]